MALSTRVADTPAVFLDKDGTLLVDVPYNVDPRYIELAPGADYALSRLGALGVPLIVVSNQPGLALGYFDTAALDGVARHLADLFEAHGARLSAFHYCPHAPAKNSGLSCTCRKPAPGMLQRAARTANVSLARSWMIGDILDDVEAGKRAGCRSILIDNGNETEWRQDHALRVPDYTASDLVAATDIVVHDLLPHASVHTGTRA